MGTTDSEILADLLREDIDPAEAEVRAPVVDAARAALETITSCDEIGQLPEVHTSIFGRKQGTMTELLKQTGKLAPELRPVYGKWVNIAKSILSDVFNRRQDELENAAQEVSVAAGGIDVTKPGRKPQMGNWHPVTRTAREMIRTFVEMGFEVAEGPEIETDYYNFHGLNFPPDHPALDMHDTFYVKENIVLRTHTSPVQLRAMKAYGPPIKVIMPGTVYRHDASVRHSPMFHQLEGLLVDEHINFSHLKGALVEFCRRYFGEDTRLRFRPGFFPFTEPSAEVDITCVMCNGEGCRLCSNTGWLELLGAGMVHPNVLKSGGYDPEKYVGFAFGMGIDRAAMLKYRIDEIRVLFENDLRFLKQFS